MKTISKLLLVALISCAFVSCSPYASVRSFDDLSVYMKKDEAIKKMGKKKGIARGAMINKFGQVVEVREYRVNRGKSKSQLSSELALTFLNFGIGGPVWFSEDEIETYWLYFYDGQLVQWGKAGDWEEAEKQIYDIHFNVSSNN